jgi:hypothetical protein
MTRSFSPVRFFEHLDPDVCNHAEPASHFCGQRDPAFRGYEERRHIRATAQYIDDPTVVVLAKAVADIKH